MWYNKIIHVTGLYLKTILLLKPLQATVHPVQKVCYFQNFLDSLSCLCKCFLSLPDVFQLAAISFHPNNGNGLCNYDFVHDLNSLWIFRLLLSLTSSTFVSELSPQNLSWGSAADWLQRAGWLLRLGSQWAVH